MAKKKLDTDKLREAVAPFVDASGLPSQSTDRRRARAEIHPDDELMKQTFLMRKGLHRALKQKAFDEDTSIRVLLMRGLKEIGLPVTDNDLRQRRQG